MTELLRYNTNMPKCTTKFITTKINTKYKYYIQIIVYLETKIFILNKWTDC
jgi:predicted transcriptional regulator